MPVKKVNKYALFISYASKLKGNQNNGIKKTNAKMHHLTIF